MSAEKSALSIAWTEAGFFRTALPLSSQSTALAFSTVRMMFPQRECCPTPDSSCPPWTLNSRLKRANDGRLLRQEIIMSATLVLQNRIQIDDERIDAPEISGEIVVAALWLVLYLLMALRHLW
jgi:hypothetical protein